MKHEDLVALIKRHTQPGNRYYAYGAYAMKEIFEQLAEDYIREEDFIKAMDEVGYKSKKGHYYKVYILPNETISRYYWGRGADPKFIGNG